MKTEVLRNGELQILLNMLGDEIEISYPLTNQSLLKISRKKDHYSLKLECSEDDLVKAPRTIDDITTEMPSLQDIEECLLCSNITKFSNMEDLRDRVKMYSGLKRKTSFSPDTNLLYHRFISNSGLIESKDVVLVDTVRYEIESSLNYKYSPEQIMRLRNASKYDPHLLDELINRRMKKSRKAAYLAKTEYLHLKENALEIQGIEPSTKDKENNDRIITRTLKKAEKEREIHPILITADNSMIDLCETEGLEYLLLKIPKDNELRETGSEEIAKLLFSTAAVLGLIKINSYIMYGEFNGKTENDTLKLLFINENNYIDFTRELNICRELVKLEIKQ